MKIGLSLAITAMRTIFGGGGGGGEYTPSLDFSDARNSMYL